jgi:RNA polymerase sigma-70 factor (ECF subfamily)
MRERESEIKAAIAKLPEDYRTLIILRETQDLSYQELADATGVGVNTVKSRLSRARAALQCILDKE